LNSRVSEQIEAYKGLLEFRLGHAHHMGAELSRDKTWGVQLEGQGITVATVVRIGQNSLRIEEDVWTVTKGGGSGHAPTHMQLLRLLSDVKALKIRGNYFRTAETTWIDRVTLHSGSQDTSKLRASVSRSAPVKIHTERAQQQHQTRLGVGLVLERRMTQENTSRFYVKRMQSGSPAHFCNTITVGDRLMLVDRHTVDARMLTLKDVAQLLMGDEASTVSLTLFSEVRLGTYTQVLERRKMHIEAPFTHPAPHQPPPGASSEFQQYTPRDLPVVANSPVVADSRADADSPVVADHLLQPAEATANTRTHNAGTNADSDTHNSANRAHPHHQARAHEHTQTLENTQVPLQQASTTHFLSTASSSTASLTVATAPSLPSSSTSEQTQETISSLHPQVSLVQHVALQEKVDAQDDLEGIYIFICMYMYI